MRFLLVLMLIVIISCLVAACSGRRTITQQDSSKQLRLAEAEMKAGRIEDATVILLSIKSLPVGKLGDLLTSTCAHLTSKSVGKAGLDDAVTEVKLLVRCYEMVLRLNPTLSRTWMNYGLIFFQRQMYDEAARVYSILLLRSDKQQPVLSMALAEHWSLHNRSDLQHDAEMRAQDTRKRHLLDRESFWPAEAWYMVASSQEMTHDNLTISLVAFRTSVQLNPNYLHAFHGLVHLSSRLCIWDDRDMHFDRTRQLIDAAGDKGVDGLGPIFALNYPITVQQVCVAVKGRGELVKSQAVPHKQVSYSFQIPSYRIGKSPVKIRLAVLSADLNIRPVGKLIQSVFRLMDFERFEIAGYSLEINDGSAELVNIVEGMSAWEWVKNVDTGTIATKINDWGTHVLLDLNAFTAGGRASVGVLRPCPVQINYLGFPFTMGLPSYDYVITDRIVTPPEHIGCFVEKFAIMPNMYMVNDYRQSYPMSKPNQPPPRALLDKYNIPHDRLLFANFNHLQKLDPVSYSLWMQAMKRTPNAMLWLLRFPREAEPALRREAEKAGVSADRIMFTDKFPDKDHIDVKRAASLLLDTLDYNAHVSGLDALWIGLPLVTRPGDRMARRCGASFLLNMGLPELVACTQQDFADIATILGRNATKLAQIREKVHQERQDGELFDTPSWVQDFQRMLVAMVEIAVANNVQVSLHNVGKYDKFHISIPRRVSS